MKSLQCTPIRRGSAITRGTISWRTGTSTDIARGELAHSTHLYGAGTYDPVHGEHQRVRVTLATGIPKDVVTRANLNYLDPASVDLAAWKADADALVVPDAGEVLYRLR